MALRKEPQRRYASADQFSEDITRHLSDLPVVARPDTRGYRAAKFVQRHKASVAAAAVVFVSLTGGIAAALWQAHIAKQERDRARVEQAKADRMNAFLKEMISYSAVSGMTPTHKHDATVAEMLDDAAGRVEKELSDQPEVKSEMLATIGGTYEALAKYEPCPTLFAKSL